jgi:hypothetical protein
MGGASAGPILLGVCETVLEAEHIFQKGILEQCVLTFTTLHWNCNFLMLPYLKYMCI